jgi:catechol 2,3-dioxygenase-like lactoylglutathione lyase family enzyme
VIQANLVFEGPHGVFANLSDGDLMVWELSDMDELKDAYQVVLDNNVEIAGFGDHGVTKGLYIRDPDGIEIELFIEAPEFEKTPLQEILTGGAFQGPMSD